MFQDPTDTKMICFMISKTGDWTKALHTAIHEPMHRRLWVSGPVVSPFETATDSDQVISVASGIGITAALSVITSHADTRKMHLIWSVRDASLLEFVMDYGARFDEDAYTFIYYTGKRELIFRRAIPHSVFLLKGRPDLDHLISAIVAACQEGVRIKKPEEMGITNPKVSLPKKDLESASSAQHLFHCELRRLSMTYTGEELFTAAVRRSHLDAPGVSYEGLRSLVSEIFWRKLSDEQLRTVFSHVDKDKSGIINAREFGEFLEEMNELGDINKREAGDAVALDEEMDFSFHSDQAKLKGAVKYEHFRIMYCGGSLPVVKALKDVSTAHNIPLELENFSW
jgi:ferredoxin-NADP reductase